MAATRQCGNCLFWKVNITFGGGDGKCVNPTSESFKEELAADMDACTSWEAEADSCFCGTDPMEEAYQS